MLTKEFAQRVELSEKQVRKIVQHLEERGYQLSKTEYRGREATDFKEEDIELFKDIADKVKQTNSYDLAFDELEKDFLQVIVKNDDKNLPTNQNVAQLVEDLRLEIQKMREERHLLGQMMNQVHQQQQELKELQNQLTTKIDSNSESLKAIKHHKRLSKKHKHLKLKYWLNQQIKLKVMLLLKIKLTAKIRRLLE